MKKFSYTKDDGTTSDRVLHVIAKPSHTMALDLTQLSQEDANTAQRLYEQWDAEVNKPYKKLEAAFKKEHLKSYDDFLKDNDFQYPVIPKSFKPAGLVEVE